MHALDLLNRAKAHLARTPRSQRTTRFPLVFTGGAQWMMEQLNALDSKQRSFNPTLSYELYGYLKYGSCLLAFGVSGVSLWYTATALTPVAILVFYSCEVQLLFLFPLLIDGSPRPLRDSLRRTQKIGTFRTVGSVLVIGGYMLIGLFNVSDPLRHWYVGCLAVLIWYSDEYE